jgi:hypothetical protein
LLKEFKKSLLESIRAENKTENLRKARFPRIAVMARQFLAIPAASATAERVFSFAGLTLSRPAQISA